MNINHATLASKYIQGDRTCATAAIITAVRRPSSTVFELTEDEMSKWNNTGFFLVVVVSKDWSTTSSSMLGLIKRMHFITEDPSECFSSSYSLLM